MEFDENTLYFICRDNKVYLERNEMAKKELVERLNEFEDDEEIWFFHDGINPNAQVENICVPVRCIVPTASGILLKCIEEGKIRRNIGG